jgi:hypothetical protein
MKCFKERDKETHYQGVFEKRSDFIQFLIYLYDLCFDHKDIFNKNKTS